MKIVKYLMLASIALSISSCNSVSQEQYDKVESENEKLELENNNLKKELDELLNGSERLLKEGKSAFEKEEFNIAKDKLSKLVSKHPTSSEHHEATILLAKVDEAIKAQLKKEQDNELAKINAEKQRLANAVKKLRTSKDDMKDITWYYDKSTPRNANYNSFHIYMGTKNGGTPWLRFRIQYTDEDWIFIEKYLIKTDNTTHTIYPGREVERDNGYGDIWEWYDSEVTAEYYTIIKDIIASKSTRLRSEGKQYYKDRTITAKEKEGLKNVLDAYEALGGKLQF